MTLISTHEFDNNLSGNAKLIDASWHFLSNRNGFKEYQKEHIENAIFFDLEKHSNQQKNLPHNHFLPKKSDWEKTLSEMGISNDDKVVIYDNSDLITSCRCWFQFLYFGHRPDLVFILDGGLKKWKLENRKITNKETKIKPSKYFAKENTHMIKTKLQIEENIKKDEFKLLDARSKERFNGEVKEPRPGVRSGSIEGSICMPYSECINPKDNSFLNKKILDIKSEKKVNRYVPLSKRQDRPEAVLWLTKNFPQLSDGQIVKLVGSTKKTVSAIRNKSYWNSSSLSPKDPVVSNLCTQADIKNAVDKADRKAERKKKEIERQKKKLESAS